MKKTVPGASYDKQGFTLVELLVVISIIAILSVIGITIFSSVQKNGRDAQRLSNIRNLMNALEQYYSVNGQYPGSGSCNGSGRSEYTACCSSWGQGDNWIIGLVPTFIASLPHDPQEPSYPGGPDICYLVGVSDKNSYAIQYRLEIPRAGAGSPPEGRRSTENGQTVYVYQINHDWKY